MDKNKIVQSILGKDINNKKSRIPARLDLLQSLTGLFLALFILFHILFESSILFGKDSMLMVCNFFEGEFLIEGGSPWFIIILAIVIFGLFMFHASLALRKFPHSYREYFRFQVNSKLLKHSDTSLWFTQVVTGFILMFFGSIHLYMVMTKPEDIGPFISSDRVYSDWMWPMYLILLITVVIHTAIGIYRLIVKWGVFDGDNPKINRFKSRKVVKIVMIFYIILGLASLLTYMKIGYDHKDNYGQRYIKGSEAHNAN